MVFTSLVIKTAYLYFFHFYSALYLKKKKNVQKEFYSDVSNAMRRVHFISPCISRKKVVLDSSGSCKGLGDQQFSKGKKSSSC